MTPNSSAILVGYSANGRVTDPDTYPPFAESTNQSVQEVRAGAHGSVKIPALGSHEKPLTCAPGGSEVLPEAVEAAEDSPEGKEHRGNERLGEDVGDVAAAAHP